MRKETTAQRLRKIMSDRNLRQVDILTLAEPFCKKFGVNLKKNDLSQYCSGKVDPGQDKLTILGLALGVSEPWLMGFDVPMDRSIAPITEGSDGRTEEYIRLFSLLNDSQKDFIIQAIKGLLLEK
ncbi:MAG: transcriptional regulator [Clostridia bacterium]|nr:transcriptional regulator [Clostridia bacterium]